MRVSVETGCRLHLGFTNLSEDIGRCFGSIGVAIDRPGTSIVFEEHDELTIAGEDREPVRAAVRPLAVSSCSCWWGPARSGRGSRSSPSAY